jgi:hypothetical protein
MTPDVSGIQIDKAQVQAEKDREETQRRIDKEQNKRQRRIERWLGPWR